MTLELLFFALFFLIGSLPTAFLVGKITQGKDLRKFGSGNIGATNAFRVLGKKAGFFVFIVDFLKGFLPIFITRSFFLGHENFLWVAAAPILGHIFTPFLGFKGGKGIATGAGVLLAFHADLFIFTITLWIVVFIALRIVSLASLAALIPLPFLAWYRGNSSKEIVFYSLLCSLYLWTHRSNLGRILSGQEKALR